MPSITHLQREVSQINEHKRISEMTGYLVHCAYCCAAIIVYTPRPEYEMILIEPCPMCNGGLEQSFSCDYCSQKNTIYWDKRHFVPETI
jgi:hypothetical protein